MKNTLLLFLFAAFTFAAFAQQEQYHPYKKFGSDIEVLTLSNGKYDEFFDYDTIAIVGSAVLNTKTMKVIGFVEEDTMYSEATMEPEVVSRWLSPDPLAAKYPEMSPYNFVINNPLIFIDPDGRDIELIIGGPYTDEIGKEHPYGHVALRVFNEKEGYDFVYDFGRYGAPAKGIWGVLPDGSNPKGEGILNVFNDGDVYIQAQQEIRNSVGYQKQTSTEQDKAIIDYFTALANGGEKRDAGEQKTTYKLEEDYWIKGPNCTTMSQDGLDQINMDLLGDEYDPREASKLMEEQYRTKDFKRIEYKKGGEKSTTYDPATDKYPEPIDVGGGMKFSPE